MELRARSLVSSKAASSLGQVEMVRAGCLRQNWSGLGARRTAGSRGGLAMARGRGCSG